MENNIEFTRSLAVAIIEGYAQGAGSSGNEKLQAWGYLIQTGDAWELQGRYERTATRYIEEGIINEEGEVDWGLVKEVNKSS